MATVEAYAPSTRTWSVLPDLPAPTAILHATTGADGRIYVLVIVPEPKRFQTYLWAYTPATGTWTTNTLLPVPSCHNGRHGARRAHLRLWRERR